MISAVALGAIIISCLMLVFQNGLEAGIAILSLIGFFSFAAWLVGSLAMILFG